jgi:hypothetical protein
MANNYKRPDVAPVHGKAGRVVVVDGTPAAGTTKMGFKGPGGRPANQPPKSSHPGTVIDK